MNDDINNKRNPYINDEEQGELRHSIVAFVDILGFKEFVKNAKKEGKSQAFFTDFHDVLSTWFKRIESVPEIMFKMSFIGGKKDKNRIRIFTDCILMGCPIRKNEGHHNFIEGCNEFFEVIQTLDLFQLEMANSGYFVRGAITIDELYMDDVIIYGAGAIDAYEAESKQAIYPRIILTKPAEAALMEIDKDFVKQGRDNYISKYFYRDNDGQLFLNYLESIKIGDSDYQFVDELEKHKLMVEKKLSEYQNKPHILEKYIWAANYHNCFCNQPPCYDDYKINLTQYQMQPTQTF